MHRDFDRSQLEPRPHVGEADVAEGVLHEQNFVRGVEAVDLGHFRRGNFQKQVSEPLVIARFLQVFGFVVAARATSTQNNKPSKTSKPHLQGTQYSPPVCAQLSESRDSCLTHEHVQVDTQV